MSLSEADEWAEKNVSRQILEKWKQLALDKYEASQRGNNNKNEKEARSDTTEEKEEREEKGIRKWIGFFLSGVRNDVKQEKIHELEKDGLTWNSVTQSVTNVAKKYFEN